ncbi:ATP-binding protein [Kitasatospora azatica]|uniref:ATP-binding protein n=1 Tax=Kitasatospora azatica TaxID=58347 RepID=UPI00055A3E12|nr:ATP-binding protein [Kitasatospora azatica]
MPEIPLPSIPAIPSHWRLPAELSSVGHARRLVASALPRPCPAQLSYEVRLLTSELVTNAIRHGARACEDEHVELVFWAADGHYWVAVSDPGPTQPTLVAPGHNTAGGRGLILVDALCDTWAVVPRPTRGKSVVAGIKQS